MDGCLGQYISGWLSESVRSKRRKPHYGALTQAEANEDNDDKSGDRKQSSRARKRLSSL